MKKIITLSITIAILLSVVSLASGSAQPETALSTNTSIMSVVEDESVVVRLEEFPDNETFFVYMGFRDTMGLNGYLVSKLETNDGGTFLGKFLIPEGLKGEEVVSIRFQSQDSAHDWYNYFYNQTGSNPAPGSGTTYNHLKPGFPTFVLLEMVKGQSIRVQTKYFPPDERWAVFVNSGSGAKKNSGWIEVKGFNSSDGGVQTIDIPIPASLQYAVNIAVMFYNVDDGFRTYNLYDNQHYP